MIIYDIACSLSVNGLALINNSTLLTGIILAFGGNHQLTINYIHVVKIKVCGDLLIINSVTCSPLISIDFIQGGFGIKLADYLLLHPGVGNCQNGQLACMYEGNEK